MFQHWIRMLGGHAPKFQLAGGHPGSKRPKTTRSQRRLIRLRRKHAQNRNRYTLRSRMWKAGIR